MNTVKNILFGKNAIAIIALSKEFLKIPLNDKVPTVTDFENNLKLVRGTIQNAMNTLKDNGAITLDARGRNGTFLKDKNMPMLLKLSGITMIMGCMPLPYSKRYEGLATGLLVCAENQYNIPCSMAYMRGARNRIGMLLMNRYDYAIVSKLAANHFLKEKPNRITIVKDFGKGSYLSDHIILFSDDNNHDIKDGMVIGIDNSSIDHRDLTHSVCDKYDVTYVDVDYNKVLSKVLNKEIDAAIWNKDEIYDKYIKINYKVVTNEDEDDTTAVLVVNSERSELISLLNDIIDEKIVLDNQKLVLEGKIIPSY